MDVAVVHILLLSQGNQSLETHMFFWGGDLNRTGYPKNAHEVKINENRSISKLNYCFFFCFFSLSVLMECPQKLVYGPIESYFLILRSAVALSPTSVTAGNNPSLEHLLHVYAQEFCWPSSEIFSYLYRNLFIFSYLSHSLSKAGQKE